MSPREPAGTAGGAAGAAEEPPPVVTTIRLPAYLAENIRRWLYEHPEHTQHSMVFAGLAKLGIEVREEDLEPKRRPRGARHRAGGTRT